MDIEKKTQGEWECERARRIERIQGNRNEVVISQCRTKEVKSLWG